MSDRELLELAAKAAGIGALVWGEKYKVGDDEIDFTDDLLYIRSGQPDEGDVYWNPLTDDGDALRLAVTKRLCVHVQEKCAWAFQDGDNIVGDTAASSLVMFSDTNGDALSAVRLAITRAAAEIGRRMQHE